jgi:Kef-type K+ transport system membrane component KefB
MVESSERILRQSLDDVDRLRKRSITTFLFTAVFIAQAAWFALAGVNRVDVKQALVLATFALAVCVFGGVFVLVGHITRMTQRILQAIELMSKG